VLVVTPALIGIAAAGTPVAAKVRRGCTVAWRNDRHFGWHVSTACLPAIAADRSRVAVLTVRDAEFTIDLRSVDRAGPPVSTFEAPDTADESSVRSALRDANRALARGGFRPLAAMSLGNADPRVFRIEGLGLDIRYSDGTLEVRRDGALVGRSQRHELRHDRDPDESESPMIGGIYVADDRAFVLLKIEYMSEAGVFSPDADWEVVRLQLPAAVHAP
jgi:hypothetical protein